MIDAHTLEQSAVVVVCSRRSLLSVSAVVVALFACWAISSGCAARPATWRSVAERRWLELRSEAFILATDLPRLTALERFRELEEVHRALLDFFTLVAPGPRPHVEPFHILHLARCSDLAATSHGTVAGFVMDARDFSGTRLMVTCDATRERRDALLHQMTHALTAAHFTQLQPWLVEGLARYYQTLRVEDTSVIIGVPPPNQFTSDRRRHSGVPASLERMRYSGAPDLATLMSMTDAFYKRAVHDNHRGAWRLVHLLSSPTYRDRFVVYLRTLHAGSSPDGAWRAAFGDIAMDRIAAQYANYAKRMAVHRYRVRQTSRTVRDPDVQALRPGEVHALWVRLYMARRSGADDDARTAVREHLSFMASEDPEWTGLSFWRAVQAHYSDDEGERERAEQLLRAYAVREPRDFRAWVGLVRIGINRSIPPDYLGVDGAVPAGLAAVEADVRELLRSGGTARALNLVGWYYALRRLPRTGLAFAFRSVRADPTCGACHDTLALLLYQDGRLADAVAAQERAVALMAEDDPARTSERRLEIFRRAWRNQAGTSR